MARKLRIGIDARAAAEEPAGRGRYVRELLRALPEEHEYVLYARREWDGAAAGTARREGDGAGSGGRLQWRLVHGPDVVWHRRVARMAGRECDVFLSTNSYLTAWFTRLPTVVVVHDMVAWMPEMRPQKRAARIERATAKRALRRAASVICVSAATERDLVARFPNVRGKTVVVPHGVSPAFAAEPSADLLAEVRERHRLGDAFVLSTGTLEPRKNLPALMLAHAALPDAPPLLLVGPKGWDL